MTMASLTAEEKYGYEDSRFEKEVDENFHCSICYNVLKEPMMCRHNEHIFCRACITEHLTVNSHTCPECNDDLTVETLRRAPRLAVNYLSGLKINCDYSSRGCQEFVPLEKLDAHVEKCGFAPVKCSNEECEMVVNKRELIHHETAVCKYRKVVCHNCVKIEQDIGEMKEKMEKDVGVIKGSLNEIQDQVTHDNKTLTALKEDVDQLKVMMSIVLDKLSSFESSIQIFSNMSKTLNEDIITIGGPGANSTVLERYSCREFVWKIVLTIENGGVIVSFFVYKDKLFVVFRDSIQVLNLNEDTPALNVFPATMPDCCANSRTVIYHDRVLFIGGYNQKKGNCDSSIWELNLSAPYTYKRLCQMNGPRQYHSAEVLKDKVIVFGGEKAPHLDDILESVIEFDTINNTCKFMPPLPRAVSGAASVCWQDKVILLGGRAKNGEALNTVLMYDCQTGKTIDLPPMLEKRVLACAAITGNIIVVVGGIGINSVERFVLGGYSWEYLPAMNEKRSNAIAAVVTARPKYKLPSIV